MDKSKKIEEIKTKVEKLNNSQLKKDLLRDVKTKEQKTVLK